MTSKQIFVLGMKRAAREVCPFCSGESSEVNPIPSRDKDGKMVHPFRRGRSDGFLPPYCEASEIWEAIPNLTKKDWEEK
jgi:hypothetical protein